MRQMKLIAAVGLLGIVSAGCYTYEKPPTSITGITYTQRKHDKADELLKNVRVLTLNDALRIAVANNPNYISAYHAVNAAKMRYNQEMGKFLPTIGATASYGTSKNYSGASGGFELDYSRNDYLRAGIGASWNVFNGMSDYFAVKLAGYQEKYQKSLEEDACRVLLRGVTYAYNEIMLAKENIRIAESDKAFQSQCLKETQTKFEIGTSAKSEVLNFMILENNAENSRIVAVANYEVAIYALAVLMGYPEGTLPEWVQLPEEGNTIDEKFPTVELYLDAALANRPDLRAYRELVTVSEYQVKMTYGAYSPSINLYAQYDYNKNKNVLSFEDSTRSGSSEKRDTPSYDVGISASWTLFNGLVRYNQTKEAYANLAVQQYAAAEAWLSVVQEVRTSYTLYKRSITQAKLYKKTLEYSVEQRDLVKREFDEGLINITRLNEVQNDLTNAQAQLASSFVNMKNAKIRLEAAANMNVVGYFHGDTEAEYQVVQTANQQTQSVSCDTPIVAKTSDSNVSEDENPQSPVDEKPSTE